MNAVYDMYARRSCRIVHIVRITLAHKNGKIKPVSAGSTRRNSGWRTEAG